MGRLKRKKTTTKKKAKGPVVNQAAPTPGKKDVVENKDVSIAAPTSEAKPKKIVPLKKTSIGNKVVPAKQKKNFYDKSLQFLREVKIELKKVTWPSRKQAMGSTVVVLILVVIISVFLGAVDVGLSSLIQVVLN
jgi:preprotein translocase subunit SecE